MLNLFALALEGGREMYEPFQGGVMYISLGTSVIDWCKSVEVDGGIELRGIFN
jgi:hypothetical protein